MKDKLMNEQTQQRDGTGKKSAAVSVRPTLADRREAIIHAAWRLVVANGLAAVTIRAISREIGSTTGVVMHYFTTKEEVVEEMIDRLYSGLRASCSAALSGTPADQRLEKLLLATLPIRSKTAFGWKLSVALQGEVLRSERIAELHRQHYQKFEDDICAELQRLQGIRVLADDVDLKLLSRRLMVFIDGVGTQFVLRPGVMTPKVLRQLLKQELSFVPFSHRLELVPAAAELR
jgi:AcrR family transcriptional regulator